MRKPQNRTEFGARMYEARISIKPKLSQARVAKLLGISQGTVSEAEHERQGSTHTAQFAVLYNVNAHWLETGEGERSAPSGSGVVRMSLAVDPGGVALALGALLTNLGRGDRRAILGLLSDLERDPALAVDVARRIRGLLGHGAFGPKSKPADAA